MVDAFRYKIGVKNIHQSGGQHVKEPTKGPPQGWAKEESRQAWVQKEGRRRTFGPPLSVGQAELYAMCRTKISTNGEDKRAWKERKDKRARIIEKGKGREVFFFPQ